MTVTRAPAPLTRRPAGRTWTVCRAQYDVPAPARSTSWTVTTVTASRRSSSAGRGRGGAARSSRVDTSPSSGLGPGSVQEIAAEFDAYR